MLSISTSNTTLFTSVLHLWRSISISAQLSKCLTISSPNHCLMTHLKSSEGCSVFVKSRVPLRGDDDDECLLDFVPWYSMPFCTSAFDLCHALLFFYLHSCDVCCLQIPSFLLLCILLCSCSQPLTCSAYVVYVIELSVVQ